jgi:hypothetical protein
MPIQFDCIQRTSTSSAFCVIASIAKRSEKLIFALYLSVIRVVGFVQLMSKVRCGCGFSLGVTEQV